MDATTKAHKTVMSKILCHVYLPHSLNEANMHFFVGFQLFFFLENQNLNSEIVT